MEFDPTVAKQRVRVRDDPAFTGLTTGRTRRSGPIEFSEVEFGPNNRQFKPVSALELVVESEDAIGLFARGSFGTPSDLRRLLTFEKLRGDLTNVFYSMEASNTDFYPHQFKPVLTFIQSTLGRLLIADEVGLGKTIEATLIWLELRAREDARRLLVICPSMLREKWQRDLKSKFNIDARLVNAEELLEQLNPVADGGYHHSFALIASLEGLRPPREYESAQNGSVRARLARLLDFNQSMIERSLIDLAIIDESHYLRNPSTASNLLGRLVRGAAGNLLLLTATPIQLGSENLYQMLRLLDPDFFGYATVFDVLLEANKPVVAALRALWNNPPQIPQALASVRTALEAPQFNNDPVLLDVEARLVQRFEGISPDERIALAHMVETRSLLSRYIVRSRKRDVLERRVVREATSLMVGLSDMEQELYETVTENIRTLARDAGEFGIFRLIARQRQLASCMPAAIRAWESSEVLDDYLDEYLWDDLGLAGEEVELAKNDTLADEGATILPATGGDLYDQLCRLDSKYAEFLRAIRIPVAEGEKVVVFAFYRGTLDYLSRRLMADGISAIVLKGGMGPDKQDVLEEFQRPDGPRVLLSSEVGSEGIDLQFCRIMVNYDLPWNPMRVEQRIGRIDRLGQNAEKITIINLFLADTIEDRILKRLYDRIRVFEESIGDLEEILGEVTTEIARRLLDPDLNDQQREERALQSATAIENSRAQQDQLEKQAMNLIGFTDYLLDTIQQSRKRKRWVSSTELIEYTRDFFLHSYPGCVFSIGGDDGCSGKLSLSDEARTSLETYLRRIRPVVGTSLHRGVTEHLITFDPKAVSRSARHPEVITAKHPLIGWITEHHEREHSFLHSTAAAILSRHSTPLRPGDYVMVVQRWSVRGLRTRTELAYQACALNGGGMMSADESEELATVVSQHGQPFRNVAHQDVDLAAAEDHLGRCNDRMGDRLASFIAQIELENQVLCDQEESAARSLAERRIAEFHGRVERFRASDQNHLIPMTEGLIRREENLLRERRERVAVRRQVDPSWAELVAVLIRIE